LFHYQQRSAASGVDITAIRNAAVVAKSAVSYKFTVCCGFFAAYFLQIFDVIRWRVCGC
jgi:hypothetical protein